MPDPKAPVFIHVPGSLAIGWRLDEPGPPYMLRVLSFDEAVREIAETPAERREVSPQ